MQKKVNVGGLSHRKSCLKIDLWLPPRSFTDKTVPYINIKLSLNDMDVPRLFMQVIMVYAVHLLSFWGSGIGARQWVPIRPAQKTLGTESLINFPGIQYLIPVVTIH